MLDEGSVRGGTPGGRTGVSEGAVRGAGPSVRRGDFVRGMRRNFETGPLSLGAVGSADPREGPAGRILSPRPW